MQLRESLPRDLSQQEPEWRRAFAREVLPKLIADAPREEVCEVLVNDLVSDDVIVRENAAIVLGELTPASENTVERLLQATDDPCEAVRVAAEDSLLLLVHRDSYCRKVVEQCAHNRRSDVAPMAVRLLERSRTMQK